MTTRTCADHIPLVNQTNFARAHRSICFSFWGLSCVLSRDVDFPEFELITGYDLLGVASQLSCDPLCKFWKRILLIDLVFVGLWAHSFSVHALLCTLFVLGSYSVGHTSAALGPCGAAPALDPLSRVPASAAPAAPGDLVRQAPASSPCSLPPFSAVHSFSTERR